MRSQNTTSKRSRLPAAKTARVEARTSPAKKALYQRAAELKGQTFTEFVENSLDEAAERAHKEFEAMQLSERDAKAFVSALLSDDVSAPRLRKAVEKHKSRTAS